MIAPRLLNIFKTFSPDEIKSFEKFLLSPFFNTSRTYVKFYEELVKFYPEFKSDKLTSEYIFDRLFEGKPFNKQTMWNLNSGLEKLAEEFLIHSALIKRPFEKLKLIIKELELKKLDKLYVKKLNEMENMIRNSSIDGNYFAALGELEESKISYWEKVKGLQEHFSENIMDSIEIYTLTYLANILGMLNDLEYFKMKSSITSQQYKAMRDFVNSVDFTNMIKVCKDNKFKYAHLIEFYCNTILCILNFEKEEYFYKVKKYLFENHRLFDRNEKKSLTSSLASYCVYKNLYGNTNFQRELFTINKFRLKQGLATYENGRINKALYIQIAGNAAVLKEIRWAEKFIEKYTPFLLEVHQESMKSLAKASLYYHSKKYKYVLDSLSKIEFVDIADKINVKHLIARAYYEMKEFESLLYHIDSTLHFLRNNKNVSSYISEVNGKFFNYLYSLVTAIENYDSEKLIKLEENLRNEKAVTGKIWLLEKIAEAVHC